MKERHISKEEIEHIANLACIELSEEEKETYTKQFNDILSYFNVINRVDTENVPPTYHALDLVNVHRSDKVTPSLPLEAVLKNTPKHERRFIKAPRII
jgi:aspartyl-tRNA(Asn)/glutamyl-tRNA(Gln) amidotransferase subunit C